MMPSIFDLFQDDFFKGVMDLEVDRRGSAHACPSCGMTHARFHRTGRFGCAQCYEVFADWIEPLVQRVQGTCQYEGSVPTRGAGVFRIQHHMKRLRQQLQRAVQEERFEEATQLRDELRALEASLSRR